MNWLEKFLVSKWVKGWLDKLPLNNFKTVIGVIVLILGIVGQIKPEYSTIINWVIELLKPYASLITDAGIVTLVTGVIHKIAKWIDGGKSE